MGVRTWIEQRIGLTAEPYNTRTGGTYVKAGKVLAVLGAAGAALSGTPALPAGLPRRIVAAASGAALIGASIATRWGIFHAGLASARDPKYTVVPQRKRLDERAAAKVQPTPSSSPQGAADPSGLTRKA
jgi:hypothetical protein